MDRRSRIHGVPLDRDAARRPLSTC